jgi:hypothetical protein
MHSQPVARAALTPVHERANRGYPGNGSLQRGPILLHPLHARGGAEVASLMLHAAPGPDAATASPPERASPAAQEATMLRTGVLRILACVLPLAACDRDGLTVPTEPVEVDGTWAGAFTATPDASAGVSPGLVRWEIEVLLAEDASDRITGAGVLRRDASAFTGGAASTIFEVDGTNAFPEVVLLLKTETGGGQITSAFFRGSFAAGDVLSGRFEGAGLPATRIQLRRQRGVLR